MVKNQKSIADFNGVTLEGAYFHRDKRIPGPHNVFLFKKNIEDLLNRLRDDNKEQKISSKKTSHFSLPIDTQMPHLQLLSASNIFINFFNPLHNVSYVYDPIAETYTRKNGDQTSDLKPKNILILEAPIEDVGEYGRLNIPLRSGRFFFFSHGNVVNGIWEKKSMEESFLFQTMSGTLLAIDDEPTWMTVVEKMDRIKWQ
jgi:hypothetical protein